MDGLLGPYAGHAAGLATSALWTITSVLGTAGARRIGVTALNALRIVLALLLLGVTHRLLAGVWVPQIGARQAWLLGLSGVIGLTIGDQVALAAFMRIGTRRTLLLMTSAPLMAGALGWWFLHETLAPLGLLGMLATVGGVAWTILERRGDGLTRANLVQGTLLAVCAALCQAVGLLLSKLGMGHGWLAADQHLHPQAAALVRMTFACAALVPLLGAYALRRGSRISVRVPGRGLGVLCAVGVAIFGPFLGMWMSLVASDRAPLGVAQTLSSLAPVLILPLARWVHREQITPRAVAGALLAVAGIAILFLAPAAPR